MPNTPNLNLLYPTPLDPATADLWGDILNDIFLALDAEAATSTIAHNFADFLVSRPVLKDYGEELSTVTSAANVATFNITNGNHFQITLSENVTTATISNPTATGDVCAIMIDVKQAASGGPYTFAWPAAVKWAGGASAPVITTTASATDCFLLRTRNGGTSWQGFICGQGFLSL